MRMPNVALHERIKAVAPIISVCIPDVADKKTWQLEYDPTASAAELAAAAAIVNAFDPNAPDVPETISDRQFFQQLAIQGVIGQSEALDAVKTGAIPAALQALVNAMPAGQQFGATMLIAGATSFDRHHPLTGAIGAAYGWSPDQMDALWCAAAEL